MKVVRTKAVQVRKWRADASGLTVETPSGAVCIPFRDLGALVLDLVRAMRAH